MTDEPSNRSNDGDNLTPFERFERLAKHVVNVPKAELDEKRKQVKRRAKRQTPTK